MGIVKVTSIDYHRNGCSGQPFYVCTFTDSDYKGEVFVGIVPANHEELYQRDGLVTSFCVSATMAAQGDIAFGSNSWRGDHYYAAIVAAIQKRDAERDARLAAG